MFWITQGRLRKRFVLQKTEVYWHDYVFCWKCWGAPLSFLFVSWKIFFLSLNELIGRHTQWSCKLRYSVEWLNILGSTPVLNLFLDQNTWIPVRMNLFLFLIKWPGKKIKASERISFFSRAVQTMFAIWRPGKKENLFYRTAFSGYFWHKFQPRPIFI